MSFEDAWSNAIRQLEESGADVECRLREADIPHLWDMVLSVDGNVQSFTGITERQVLDVLSRGRVAPGGDRG